MTPIPKIVIILMIEVTITAGATSRESNFSEEIYHLRDAFYLCEEKMRNILISICERTSDDLEFLVSLCCSRSCSPFDFRLFCGSPNMMSTPMEYQEPLEIHFLPTGRPNKSTESNSVIDLVSVNAPSDYEPKSKASFKYPKSKSLTERRFEHVRRSKRVLN